MAVQHILLGRLALFESALCMDLVQLFLGQAKVYVLRLEIGVDDLAHSVEEVKADEALLCHLSDDWKRRALVVVSFYYLQ